jgi:hypothetical protein
MAEWNSVHKPLHFRSGLETGGKLYDPPLLPYEIALIEALGCSEDEYKTFVRYAVQRSYVRPAEYENIPEIYAAVVPVVAAVAVSAKSVATTIAVNVAIGLALTAVSILLAPKAPALESPAKIKGKKLADQIGPSRFNQTTSFDNVSSLAEYGQPIPIPFGKRGTGSDGALTGGLILAPALVWSRIYSYGSYQAFEGIYVAGEYGVQAPELGGIRVGTTALNSLGNREFAVYWSSQLGENRPGPARLIAGTQDGGVSGTAGRITFTAPTEDGQFSTGFSMAYTPQADTSFGTATPVFNGTAYRFNWEVVSAPYASTEGSDNKDSRAETQAQRRKIAGSNADVLHKYENQPSEDVGKIGQPGVGRAYSRRMGFVAHSRTNGGNNIENRTIVDVRVDDVLKFEINKRNWSDFQQEDFKGTEVNLKDLKNSADSWRAQASDLLTIGSKWIIGSSVWVVEKRDPDLWTKDTTQHIYFRCTAITGVATVGIPGTRTVREPLGGYEGPWPGPGAPPFPLSSGGFNSNKHCGAAFFNICRLHMASIRPVRRDAEVVEIGIRSQVWNRANGLCNFNAIPSPGKDGKLHRMDKKNITLTTPRMDKYFERTSCFSLWVRPVQQYGQTQQPWTRIPEVICVTGNAPIDLYNYLRIRPRQAGYYEYRLVPRTGSDIAINSIDTNLALRLNSRTGDIIGQDYDTPYGAFRLTTNGEMVTIAQIQRNDELVTDPSDIEAITPVASTIPTSLSQYAQSASNGSDQQVINAWLREVLGRATNYAGGSNSATLTHDKPGVGRITFKIKADSRAGTYGVDVGKVYVNLEGSTYKWTNVRYSVTYADGAWNTSHAFTIKIPVDNPFSRHGGYNNVYVAWRVTAVQTIVTGGSPGGEIEGRIFEDNSQVSDCSHYLELTKSNESGPEHEIVYVNEYISNETQADYYGMSTLGFAVKSSGQIGGIGQLRAWVPTGISVYRLIEQDNKPSNLFADLVYYLLTSKSQGVGNVVPAELIDVESLTIAAQFQRANRIFFDGVVEDSDSLRSFLYDNAALQLCNFTIKNGRFGMMPALPYDSNYEISTRPIPVEQIFTAGNIIEDSLQVQYIDAAQRANFRALVSWRVTIENDLPTQASALVDWADIPEGSRSTTQQAFDLTDFCTNRAQALKTARFLLSIRRRITHTVSFKTVPDALGIQPGSYIRVITEATTYSATNNGGITDAGALRSISTIANGNYDALIYNPTTGAVTEQRITITSNTVADTALYGCLFTLLSLETGVSVYQVEQLTLDEDGLVNITAVEVPVDSSGVSIVAKDVLTEGNFRVLE